MDQAHECAASVAGAPTGETRGGDSGALPPAGSGAGKRKKREDECEAGEQAGIQGVAVEGVRAERPKVAIVLGPPAKRPAISVKIGGDAGDAARALDKSTSPTGRPLGGQSSPVAPTPLPQPPTATTKVQHAPAKPAAVFGTDDSESDEEIPLYARVRMRNLGKDTPTSAGPNSFGKTKQGFVDRSKAIVREIEHKTELYGLSRSGDGASGTKG